MHSNRERERERARGRRRERKRERVGGRGRLPGCSPFHFFLSDSPLPFLFSSPPPLLSSLQYPLPLLSSSLSFLLPSSPGTISWVSLEGKCNNAPTRWNRARSIIRQEMDGPCRAGGGHARTQFRFNKLAKQDPQSDLSLTRRQCLLLRC